VALIAPGVSGRRNAQGEGAGRERRGRYLIHRYTTLMSTFSLLRREVAMSCLAIAGFAVAEKPLQSGPP